MPVTFISEDPTAISPKTLVGLKTGGGIPTDTLTIRGGQGQEVQEQFQLREPMVVQVRDAQGRPAVGRTITFAIRTGSGTFNTTTADGTVLTGVACVANVCTARTDIDGRAAVGFIATSTASGSSFSQQTISATDGVRTVIFTVTTLLGQTLGGAAASPPLVQRLAPTGNLITGTVGTTVLDAIRVRVVVVSGPQAGQGIPNVSLGAFTVYTGAVTCNLVLGPVGGIARLGIINLLMNTSLDVRNASSIS